MNLLELSKEHPIVFFDGVCGLCNGVVDTLLRADRKGQFRFTPLQGQPAAGVLDAAEIADLQSFVVLSHGDFFRRSDAAVEILARLGVPWSLVAAILRLIPRPLRDFVYSIVAKNRYRVWGKKETCRIPSKEERARFI